eukprot:scaffold228011_cov20-Prasinocladus_malaysianus.AAC.1
MLFGSHIKKQCGHLNHTHEWQAECLGERESTFQLGSCGWHSLSSSLLDGLIWYRYNYSSRWYGTRTVRYEESRTKVQEPYEDLS